MIEANGCCGLGRLSEEVLEAMQPIMRWLRKSRVIYVILKRTFHKVAME